VSLVNHWWNVPCTLLPAHDHFADALRAARYRVQFDFIEHKVLIETSEDAFHDGHGPRSVADFYKKFMAAVAELA